MANKFAKGEFIPKNPAKYIGSHPIIYRSSWELAMMRCFDNHPFVINWASETIMIPYVSPLDGRYHKYFPDFLVIYMDKNGKKIGEVIEIKPLNQSDESKAKSKRDKLSVVVNHAKWNAAIAWCKLKGLKFRVMTKDQLFR